MITLAVQLAINVEDEVRQEGGAAVLFKYLLNPVKELSGELRCLNNLYPCCSTGSPGDELLQVRTSKEKKPACNSSSQRVGGRLKTQPVEMMMHKKRKGCGAQGQMEEKAKARLCFRDNISVWRYTIKPKRELYSWCKHCHFKCMYIQCWNSANRKRPWQTNWRSWTVVLGCLKNT